MVKTIKRESIEQVRSHPGMVDIVESYCALKPAGMGALKGLCPFHDEKTPSFTVNIHSHFWHCFGCDKGGDIISFVQDIEGISFTEAVEYLADKFGVILEYTGNSAPTREKSEISKARLIEAHRIAKESYIAQLQTAAGKEARELLYGRGFDDAAIAYFQVGYAPDSWDFLLTILRKKGFTEKEIMASGLVSQSNNNNRVYDRFRDRVMWPIHSNMNDPVGFGARRLSDNSNEPKYLNSPETLIYKKSEVLYGLDLARKTIMEERKIVIVEGYTDVMAAHLAGVKYAVATCGTAFGGEHVNLVRRLLADRKSAISGMILDDGKCYGGEVIFTFDGDAAGQKAALKVFAEDDFFGAQPFVAVSPEGLDPCDLRIKYGDEKLRETIAERKPLFAFVLQSILQKANLDTAEGRIAALHQSAPIIITIRDYNLRLDYVRRLAGWLGLSESVVMRVVEQTLQKREQKPLELGNAPISTTEDSPVGESALTPFAEITDQVERIERMALGILIKAPIMANAANAQELPPNVFKVSIHQAIYDVIRAEGGVAICEKRMQELLAQGLSQADANQQALNWYVQQLVAGSMGMISKAIMQIAVEPFAQTDSEGMWKYVRGILMSLIYQGMTRQIADLQSALRRMEEGTEAHQQAYEMLVDLQQKRRAFSEMDS